MNTPKLPIISAHLRTPSRISHDTSPKTGALVHNKMEPRPPSHRPGHGSPRRLLIEDPSYKTFTSSAVTARADGAGGTHPYNPIIRHQKNDSWATATTTTTERAMIDSKMYTLSEFAFLNVKDMNINTDLDFEDLGQIKTSMHRSTRSYSDNLRLLNDSEKRRIPFTKKNFLSKEQIELNKRIHERFNNQEKGLESVKGKFRPIY